MKVNSQVCTARMPELDLKSFKISKNKFDEQEMAACIDKLKDLVPTIPQGKKIPKVQLLQHVIDYILDLESTLDFHPSDLSPPLVQTTERKPLAESCQLNTICTSGASHLEKSQSLECSTRPTSH